MNVIKHGIQFTSKFDGVTTAIQDYGSVSERDQALGAYRRAGRKDAVPVDYMTTVKDPEPQPEPQSYRAALKAHAEDVDFFTGAGVNAVVQAMEGFSGGGGTFGGGGSSGSW